MADASPLSPSLQRSLTADLQVQKQLSTHKPQWASLGLQQAKADNLKLLELGAPAAKSKAILHGNLQIIEACFEALSAPDPKSVQWMLTVLYDMLREDASCYDIFEEALKAKVDVYKVFTAVIEKAKEDVYTSKTAAWILTSVIGNQSRFFDDEKEGPMKGKVRELAKTITASPEKFTELGVIDCVTNLLKSDAYRLTLWKQDNVSGLFKDYLQQGMKNLESETLYRVVFGIWLLSLDKDVLQELKSLGPHTRVTKKLKEIISTRRVEKVVRISLIALKSLLQDKEVCEEIVETGAYDAVCNLEFEKWRDAELYDDIRELGAQIANHVHEMSNFDRYERELHTGHLRWGYIHTTKFWGENVMKFEQRDYAAVKALAMCLQADDDETLAVACHDLGEFVALHPFGKKQVAKLNIKPRVMELMQKQGDTDKVREVRREALLCCQKIMLNKWQDIEKPKGAN
jgi:V-type H+-transporting ATPase subunit H